MPAPLSTLPLPGDLHGYRPQALRRCHRRLGAAGGAAARPPSPLQARRQEGAARPGPARTRQVAPLPRRHPAAADVALESPAPSPELAEEGGRWRCGRPWAELGALGPVLRPRAAASWLGAGGASTASEAAGEGGTGGVPPGSSGGRRTTLL